MTQPHFGRVVRHDPRSRDYPARTAPALVSAAHRRRVRPYDQNFLPFLQPPWRDGLGACTGMAAAGALMTEGVWNGKRRLYERQAVSFYRSASRIDPWEGHWPPQDTGSSGLAVAQALKGRGYIREYRHAFGITHALAALSLAPCITGTNWYSGMMNTTEEGEVRVSGRVVGGHEYELVGIDVPNERVECVNSWGKDWGKGGYFWMRFSTFDRLLREQGDVTVLVP